MKFGMKASCRGCGEVSKKSQAKYWFSYLFGRGVSSQRDSSTPPPPQIHKFYSQTKNQADKQTDGQNNCFVVC